jgi:hypothetical protein
VPYSGFNDLPNEFPTMLNVAIALAFTMLGPGLQAPFSIEIIIKIQGLLSVRLSHLSKKPFLFSNIIFSSAPHYLKFHNYKLTMITVRQCIHGRISRNSIMWRKS